MRIVLISALLFTVLGIILIPYTGLDGDELLFARPYFGQSDGATHIMHVPLSTRAHGAVLRRRAEDVFILAIILDFSAKCVSGSPPRGVRGSRHHRDFLQMGQYICRTARSTAGRRIAGHRSHFPAQRYF